MLDFVAQFVFAVGEIVARAAECISGNLQTSVKWFCIFEENNAGSVNYNPSLSKNTLFLCFAIFNNLSKPIISI